MLTEEHIRHATGKQLAELIGTTESNVSQWTTQKASISGFMLDRAAERGVPKTVLIEGLDLRRKDAETARRFQEEIESFILSGYSEPVGAA